MKWGMGRGIKEWGTLNHNFTQNVCAFGGIKERNKSTFQQKTTDQTQSFPLTLSTRNQHPGILLAFSSTKPK